MYVIFFGQTEALKSLVNQYKLSELVKKTSCKKSKSK